jgi:hypothetical protein
MNLQTKLQEMAIHIVHAFDHIIVRLEKNSAIVSEKRRKELEGSRVSLPVRALTVETVILC